MAKSSHFHPGLPGLVLAIAAACLSGQNGGETGPDPDFSIGTGDISISEMTPLEGTTVTISAVVGVNYSFGERGFLVELLLDGRLEAYTEVTAGPNITNVTVQFDWKAKAGTHTIAIMLDPAEEFGQTRHDNDLAQITVKVEARPAVREPVNWLLPVTVVLIVVAGTVAVLYIRRIRRNEKTDQSK